MRRAGNPPGSVGAGFDFGAHGGTEAAASPLCVSSGDVPRLGFLSYPIHGQGEYIVDVERGSPADRAGFEPGDVIVGLNHHRLHRGGAWSRAVAEAHAGSGRVSLSIRDVRTGGIVRCRFRLLRSGLSGRRPG